MYVLIINKKVFPQMLHDDRILIKNLNLDSKIDDFKDYLEELGLSVDDVELVRYD